MKEIDFILEFRRFVKDISKMGNVLGVRETMTKSERMGEIWLGSQVTMTRVCLFY